MTDQNDQRGGPFPGNFPAMIDKNDHKPLHRALALAVSNPERLDEIAADAGVAPEMLLNILATEDGLRGAQFVAGQMRESGALIKARALPLIDKLVDRINTLIDEGEVGVAAATKLLDTLFKLSGISEERASALRVAPPEVKRAGIFILHPGDAYPVDPPEHCIVIDLRTIAERNGQRPVIQGEVLDHE